MYKVLQWHTREAREARYVDINYILTAAAVEGLTMDFMSDDRDARVGKGKQSPEPRCKKARQRERQRQMQRVSRVAVKKCPDELVAGSAGSLSVSSMFGTCILSL